MPRQDGTGPQGQGFLTGRGMGPCGQGLGMRRGCGCGWNNFSPLRNYPTKKEELEILKEEAQALEQDLKAIQERMKELGE